MAAEQLELQPEQPTDVDRRGGVGAAEQADLDMPAARPQRGEAGGEVRGAAVRVDGHVGIAVGEVGRRRRGAELLGQGEGGRIGVDSQDPGAEGAGDQHR